MADSSQVNGRMVLDGDVRPVGAVVGRPGIIAVGLIIEIVLLIATRCGPPT